MHGIEIVVGLLTVVVALVVLASRLAVPYPILLVIGGLILGFIPGLPRVEMRSDLILLVFLPPLLYRSALNQSWRDFHANLRPISLLAVGLVVMTTLIVAAVAHVFLPGMGWAAAFVLGAVVAPTDAVAASAVAARLSIPRRILVIIEGESLVNDATALVLYQVALTAVATGTISVLGAAGQLAWATLGGIGIGLVVGSGIGWLRYWLAPDTSADATVENTVSLLTPFAAYLPAEALGASGVLAVVVAGLYLGRKGPRTISSGTRLQAGAMWQMIDFLINGLLFILVGLQLHPILHALLSHSWKELMTVAVLISLTVILARIVWVFPATYLPRWMSSRIRRNDPSPPWQLPAVVAWTGMRGGVSLAAALAIPLTTGAGRPFPERDWIIFLTFSVILATLVVQGISLPTLIRGLKLKDDGESKREEHSARCATIQAGLDRLQELEGQEKVPEDIAADLRGHYQDKIDHLNTQAEDSATRTDAARAATYHHLRQEILTAEREAVVRLRDEGVIGDDVLHTIQRELDLEEERLGT